MEENNYNIKINLNNEPREINVSFVAYLHGVIKGFDLQLRIIRTRSHRKKRLNKKYLKKYGRVEFVKNV